MRKPSKFTRAGIVTAGLLLIIANATANGGHWGHVAGFNKASHDNTAPIAAPVPAASDDTVSSTRTQKLWNFTPEWNSSGPPGEAVPTNNWRERPADDRYRPSASGRSDRGKWFTIDNMRTLYGHNSALLDQEGAEAFFSTQGQWALQGWTQGQGGYYLNRDFFPPARTLLDRCCPPEGGISVAFADFGGAGFGYTDADPQASHRTPMRAAPTASTAVYEGWGDWTEQPSA